MAMGVKRYTKMVDMAQEPNDPEDVAEAPAADAPMYPWGLHLTLNEEALEKLGLDSSCEIGDMIHLVAFGTVDSVNVTKSAIGGDCCQIGIQITHLQTEDEDTEEMDTSDEPGEPLPSKSGKRYSKGGV